jgi:outer membrane murein-binding lipoprotein Lpp
MIKNIKRALVLAVTAGTFIVLTGCATTEDLSKTRADLQSQIDQLRSDVSSAKSDAAAANARSNEAVSIANEANNRSRDTAEKIDRMFKKTMQK